MTDNNKSMPLTSNLPLRDPHEPVVPEGIPKIVVKVVDPEPEKPSAKVPRKETSR
jgi:hypothetical protein